MRSIHFSRPVPGQQAALAAPSPVFILGDHRGPWCNMRARGGCIVTMHLGLTPWDFSDRSAASFSRQAQVAESLGYESFWLPESHFVADAIPDPLMLLAAVAGGDAAFAAWHHLVSGSPAQPATGGRAGCGARPVVERPRSVGGGAGLRGRHVARVRRGASEKRRALRAEFAGYGARLDWRSGAGRCWRRGRCARPAAGTETASTGVGGGIRPQGPRPGGAIGPALSRLANGNDGGSASESRPARRGGPSRRARRGGHSAASCARCSSAATGAKWTS